MIHLYIFSALRRICLNKWTDPVRAICLPGRGRMEGLHGPPYREWRVYGTLVVGGQDMQKSSSLCVSGLRMFLFKREEGGHLKL